MARNLHRQEDGNGDNLNPDILPKPRNFTTAEDYHPRYRSAGSVDSPDYANGPPSKDEPLYYYRPWKTILCRTVADGGKSFYFQGDHRETIPALWWELTRER
ncbi:MAG: hypothetical protein WD065_01820 [Planctomycetaceae bacterium]